MSKVIKVENHVYEALELLRVGRQTFSDIIRDLLETRLVILEAMNVLEGQIKFREWQRRELERQLPDTTISTTGTGEGRMP